MDGPSFFAAFEGLRYLREKGRKFSEEDKKVLMDVQRDILKGTIPLYRELAAKGTVELSTSAFYHPIIPLLIDSASAREAMPGVNLPDVPVAWPRDASRQISSGLDLFEKVVGIRPRACGPLRALSARPPWTFTWSTVSGGLPRTKTSFSKA